MPQNKVMLNSEEFKPVAIPLSSYACMKALVSWLISQLKILKSWCKGPVLSRCHKENITLILVCCLGQEIPNIHDHNRQSLHRVDYQ